MRTAMIKVLSTMPLENSDGVKQTVDALVPLLKTPLEVTEETQVHFSLIGFY